MVDLSSDINDEGGLLERGVNSGLTKPLGQVFYKSPLFVNCLNTAFKLIHRKHMCKDLTLWLSFNTVNKNGRLKWKKEGIEVLKTPFKGGLMEI